MGKPTRPTMRGLVALLVLAGRLAGRPALVSGRGDEGDANPECTAWADSGECDANPIYSARESSRASATLPGDTPQPSSGFRSNYACDGLLTSIHSPPSLPRSLARPARLRAPAQCCASVPPPAAPPRSAGSPRRTSLSSASAGPSRASARGTRCAYRAAAASAPPSPPRQTTPLPFKQQRKTCSLA